MVEIGLLACRNSFPSLICFIKLIECVVSIIMLLVVLSILIRRFIREKRLDFVINVSIWMSLSLGFIIASSLDSDLAIFIFMTAYCYNVYFSIIVFKLGLKLLEKSKGSPYYNYFLWTAYAIIATYELFILLALIFSILTSSKHCLDLPFLIANAFSLSLAILFALLGIKYSKWQQQKLDDKLPEEYYNNPLPRFRLWILLNCIGQLMVLIESIIFFVNSCQFKNNLINEIVQIIFVFICFHMGILSTIFFFRHSAPNLLPALARKDSVASGTNKKEIEMVYADGEELKQSMFSN